MASILLWIGRGEYQRRLPQLFQFLKTKNQVLVVAETSFNRVCYSTVAPTADGRLPTYMEPHVMCVACTFKNEI